MNPRIVDGVEARFELALGPRERALRFDTLAAIAGVGEVIDTRLATPDFTCCQLRAAIELTVDGRSWTGGTFDHLWHLGGWFFGVRAAGARALGRRRRRRGAHRRLGRIVAGAVARP